MAGTAGAPEIGTSRVVAPLGDVGRMDPVYRDLYLHRARALLSALVSLQPHFRLERDQVRKESAMRTGWSTVIALAVLALALSSGDAWAQAATVTIGARASTPESVEINAGEEVEWVNAAGGTAHVWFGFVNVLGFYVGRSGVRVQFDRPGTYDYLVHLTVGTSAHSHPGTVVVK